MKIVKLTPVKKLLQEFSDTRLLVLERFRSDYEINRLLSIFEGWKHEISNNKRSIYLAGKKSSGKSAFLNYLMDTNEKILPEGTGITTKTLFILQHSDSKKAVINFKQSQSGRREIELNNKEGIKYFHSIITKKNGYNPFDFIVSIHLFYPLRYFKNYILFDTPGLESIENETDKIVLKLFLQHSYVFWIFNGKSPEQSDVIKVMDKYLHLLSQVSPGKLFLIGTHYDLLIDIHNLEFFREDARNGENYYDEDLLDKIISYSRAKILSYAREHGIFVNKIYFVDLKHKRSKKNYNRNDIIFKEIEHELIKNFVSSDIYNFFEMIRIIEEILILQSKTLNEEIKEIDNDIQILIKDLDKKENEINDVEKNCEFYKEFLLNSFESFKMGVKIHLEYIRNTHKKIYNKNLEELEADLTGSKIAESLLSTFRKRLEKYFGQNRIDIELSQEFNTFSKNCINKINFSQYRWRFFKPSKNKFNRLLKEICDCIDNFESHIKEKIDEICTQRRKFLIREIKNIKMEIDNKKGKIENLQSEWDKIEKSSNIIKSFVDNLLEELELELMYWKEPTQYEEKIFSFLELYRKIKYIQTLKKIIANQGGGNYGKNI